MSRVILRSFNPETDAAMVGQYYPNNAWYSLKQESILTKRQFFQMIYEKIDESTIHIACLEDDPTSIEGFSVICDGCLEFVFVKPHVRKEGIGTLLTNGKYHSINTLYVTNIGAAILNRHPELLGESDDGPTEENYE